MAAMLALRRGEPRGAGLGGGDSRWREGVRPPPPPPPPWPRVPPPPPAPPNDALAPPAAPRGVMRGRCRQSLDAVASGPPGVAHLLGGGLRDIGLKGVCSVGERLRVCVPGLVSSAASDGERRSEAGVEPGCAPPAERRPLTPCGDGGEAGTRRQHSGPSYDTSMRYATPRRRDTSLPGWRPSMEAKTAALTAARDWRPGLIRRNASGHTGSSSPAARRAAAAARSERRRLAPRAKAGGACARPACAG